MRLKNKVNAQHIPLTRLLLVYSCFFFAWTLYRVFFHMSVWVEEIMVKGVLFSLPIVAITLKEKNSLKSLGISTNNFFQSVYLGITIGLVLGLVGQAGNYIRHQALDFSSFNLTSGNVGAFLILSLVTAFWEQLLFSGYYVSVLIKRGMSETTTVLIVGVLFSLIHLPVQIFVQHASASQLLISFILLFTLGISCAILRLRQNNLIAPIMAHALWGVTIFLFR